MHNEFTYNIFNEETCFNLIKTYLLYREVDVKHIAWFLIQHQIKIDNIYDISNHNKFDTYVYDLIHNNKKLDVFIRKVMGVKSPKDAIYHIDDDKTDMVCNKIVEYLTEGVKYVNKHPSEFFYEYPPKNKVLYREVNKVKALRNAIKNHKVTTDKLLLKLENYSCGHRVVDIRYIPENKVVELICVCEEEN